MELTVGDLIRQLSSFDPEATLYFGGLEFYRLKTRGKKLVQVEFSQTVYEQDGQVVIENLK
jgi:hypothetical protein